MKIVILPGLDGTGQLLEPLRDELQARGLAPLLCRYPHDQPQSYAELIEDVIVPSLPKGEPYVLLGESFSGPIALALAQRGLPGLSGLVLVVTFAQAPDTMLLALSKMLPLGWVMSAPLPCWVAHKVMLGGRPVRGDQDALCRVIKLVQPEVLATRVREILALRLARKRIDLPAIYIRASEDNLVPPSSVEGIKALIPHLQVLDLDGPHLVLDTAPDQCASLIESFARGLPEETARLPALLGDRGSVQ